MQTYDNNNMALGEPEWLSENSEKALKQITQALERTEVEHIKIFTPTPEQARKMRNMGMKPLKPIHRPQHR